MPSEQALSALVGSRSGIQVWSAGCSDGAELYSIAMLLAEAHLLNGSYLLGTDCRSDALRRAKAGFFEPHAVKTVPKEFLARYLKWEGGRWRVAPPIRAAVRWRAADLIKAHEPGVWDLILCRNTTMYMRPEASHPLWDRFESSLRPGGLLVLGKAERPQGSKRLALMGPCIYRRIRG